MDLRERTCHVQTLTSDKIRVMGPAMAQHVKLFTNFDSLSLIPGTHMVGRRQLNPSQKAHIPVLFTSEITVFLFIALGGLLFLFCFAFLRQDLV